MKKGVVSGKVSQGDAGGHDTGLLPSRVRLVVSAVVGKWGLVSTASQGPSEAPAMGP